MSQRIIMIHLQKECHEQYLLIRNLETSLSSSLFLEMYEHLSENVKSELSNLLRQKEYVLLKDKINSLINKDLQRMNILTLRNKAKSLLIENWWTLRKDELIDEIEAENRRIARRNERASSTT